VRLGKQVEAEQVGRWRPGGCGKEKAGSDTTQQAREPAEAALQSQAFGELRGGGSLRTATGGWEAQEGGREVTAVVPTPQGACVLGRWTETDLDVLLLGTLLRLLLCPSGDTGVKALL